MTSWKWLFALVAVFTVIGLRTDGRRRGHLWAAGLVVAVLVYETVKYHAF
jgi:hypothetical protein